MSWRSPWWGLHARAYLCTAAVHLAVAGLAAVVLHYGATALESAALGRSDALTRLLDDAPLLVFAAAAVSGATTGAVRAGRGQASALAGLGAAPSIWAKPILLGSSGVLLLALGVERGVGRAEDAAGAAAPVSAAWMATVDDRRWVMVPPAGATAADPVLAVEVREGRLEALRWAEPLFGTEGRYRLSETLVVPGPSPRLRRLWSRPPRDLDLAALAEAETGARRYALEPAPFRFERARRLGRPLGTALAWAAGGSAAVAFRAAVGPALALGGALAVFGWSLSAAAEVAVARDVADPVAAAGLLPAGVLTLAFGILLGAGPKRLTPLLTRFTRRRRWRRSVT